jgi:hypothetical protein
VKNISIYCWFFLNFKTDAWVTKPNNTNVLREAFKQKLSAKLLAIEHRHK